MATRKKPETETALDLPSMLRETVKHMHRYKGQAYADQLVAAVSKLDACMTAGEAVCLAKDLYYHQHVGNDDAVDLALRAWADRVDDLRRALNAIGGAA